MKERDYTARIARRETKQGEGTIGRTVVILVERKYDV